MVNLLKKYKIILIVLAIPYIAFVLLMIIPTNYEAYLIGEIDMVNKTIEVDNDYQNKGSYNSTSVYNVSQISLFQKVVFSNMNSCIVKEKTEISSTLTNKELDMQGKIEHDSSVNCSIIVAYEKAGINLDYEYKGMYVYYIQNCEEVQIGDVIVANSSVDAINLVKGFRPGEEIKIIRDNEEMIVKPKSLDSIRLAYDYYELGDSDVKYTIFPSNNQGPSAGFMQTLALYDDLVEKDYTNGLVIAGTGVINMDETIGAIGAVGIKIETAHFNGVDVFFAPRANEDEAREAYRRLYSGTKTKMKLYIVDTLDDAIRCLENYGEEND